MVPRPPNSGSFLTPLEKTPINRPESEPRAAVVKVIFFFLESARGVGVRCSPPVGQWGWFQLWGVARAAVLRSGDCGARRWSSGAYFLRCRRSAGLDFVAQKRHADENPNCLPVVFSTQR